LSEQLVNGKWTNDIRSAYSYDAGGNLVSSRYQDWLDSSWVPGVQEILIVDSAGNKYSFGGYNITLSRKIIVTDVATDSANVPANFSLSQNYPNPFNPNTAIRYQLPNESQVHLSIFNVLGQQVLTVVNATEQPGEKIVQLDAIGLPSGIYFYRIDATTVSDPTKRFNQTRKMLLVK
jgi:hypothetical protein